MSLKVHETLLNNSSTAMSNLFAVNFYVSNSFGNDYINTLPFRLSGTVTLPQVSRAVVDFNYKDTNFKKVAPGFSIDKSIQFQFRVDDNYELYKFLLENLYEESGLLGSKDSTSNEKVLPYFDFELNLLGGIKGQNDLASLLATIDSTLLDGESTTNSDNIWKIRFNDCRLNTLSAITFSYDSSNPITVNATFIFNSISLV